MSASRRPALSERDLTVLRLLLRFRLLTTRQLQRLVMTDGSPVTRDRRMRAVLQRLRRIGVVRPLERHIGGIRAGSEGTVYRLTTAGMRALNHSDGTQRRRIGGEPGERYVRHILAVSELYVQLTEHTRESADEVLAFDAEPTSWRSYASAYGGTLTLRPDAFVRCASGDYEQASFVEVDLATESPATVGRKCRAYSTYARSGTEQRRIGTFPRVVWVVPHERRRHQVAAVISRLAPEDQPLYLATTTDEAVAALLGQLPDSAGGAR
ncbi:replication-relaxation family protein [Mycolicibacterium sp.]|uniref:replication-relaxation family protein n=1 Tax=Mycolicibacterium sp. TaxID=2320850 RepID=UPI0037C8EDA6